MPPVLSILFGLSRTTKRVMEVLADIVLIMASFLGAMWLRLDSFNFLGQFGVWLALPIVVPISIALFAWLGFYRAIIRHLGLKTTQTILIGVVASSGVLGVTALLFDLPIPNSVPFLYAMLALLTVGGVRFGLRHFYLREQQQHKKRVLIYGAGAAGRQLVMSLRHGRHYEPVAFVDFAPRLQGSHVQGLKVYPPEECSNIIKAYGVQMFLLAIPGASRARRQEVIESIEIMKIPVQTIPDMADVVSGKAKVTELRDVAIEDLLGRDPIPPDPSLMGANITGKVVMVTGAGGSIGSELSRQILRQHPKQLLLIDVSEYSLYRIEQDIAQLKRREGLQVPCQPILVSVQDGERLEGLMRVFSVDTIYHAAAYKHVPLVEQNMAEGIRNNVFGTLGMAKAAVSAGVEKVVLVSTDKAVRPTNVMGATKRMAELVCQALAREQSDTCFSMVRFGNVLGSSGSVVPLFREQIERGGPVTVTHPEVTRYFMTIPEAAELVIQAGAMSRGGDVFVLDMGEPIKIVDLAHRMILLSGLQPYYLDTSEPNANAMHGTPPAFACRKGDIAIEFTGLRPGEKLYEELLISEAAESTSHPRIMTANETMLDWEILQPSLQALDLACQKQDMDQVRKILLSVPVGYAPLNELVDIRWLQQVACGQSQDKTVSSEPRQPVEGHHGTADVFRPWAGAQAYGKPAASFAQVRSEAEGAAVMFNKASRN
ncbi:polysaccharide biosynthesis protein [Halomonas daqiaonensis]|uniref:NDP-sugar epimerase, includes UDP-GlcNAc-inverting 4,6-dehydratase FlaA1 and capsular polysaccharide biosynthesis protein EpsC n=1 Tax=Halomonas daqiaonensis TaxID=650850 RepID=A0A1H7HJS4_9GAMM|nr:nucleoside-diphosphate sugar epimerase/dehydratase [Halomonas daqiaonensis]SEK50529.1 NDP-sugar epimerase, includes UDP-GlcNAc-inverting 4,6-dehydratase FlaA1 and capsular polysaccharide biosynthesis protein EpsC [Halomonas daqiaonensis]